MPINLGLTHCERKALAAAFGRPYRMRRTVRILNLDHQLVQDVTDRFIDGQVNVDSRATISRSATVSLYDPTHTIGIDFDTASSGVVSPRYLLALERGIFVDELDRWVDIPVGVLWFTKPSRNGSVLTIEAQGKEAIAQYPVAKQLTFKSGTNKMSAVRSILESIGETRFRLDSTSSKLSGTFVVDLSMTPWQACKKIVDSLNWQLFYDAEGYVVSRKRPADSGFTFRYGSGGTVRTDPLFTYSDGTVFNAVRATGATPEGKQTPITKSSHVGSTHQLYITRNDQFVPLTSLASSDKLTTDAKVQAFADDTLATLLADTQTAAWDSHPVWHLEQGDPVLLTDAVDDDGTGATYSFSVPLSTFSIPLTLGSQSNGYMRRVSRSKKRLQRAA